MAIFRGSRYEGVAFTGIKDVDGITRKFLHDRKVYSPNDTGEDSVTYIIQGEEELDSIAEHLYKDGSKWWLIADVNNIHFAFDILPGDVLVIPNPDIAKGDPQ